MQQGVQKKTTNLVLQRNKSFSNSKEIKNTVRYGKKRTKCTIMKQSGSFSQEMSARKGRLLQKENATSHYKRTV